MLRGHGCSQGFAAPKGGRRPRIFPTITAEANIGTTLRQVDAPDTRAVTRVAPRRRHSAIAGASSPLPPAGDKTPAAPPPKLPPTAPTPGAVRAPRARS